MAADQQFCLRWNNHQSTLISVFDTLLENGTLVDCTLAAEGQYLKAHKVVLSACSPYMETLLSQNYDKHPILILKDVKFTELKSMMDYMYRGEVNISQDQLGTFLKAAESLQIKGLSENGEGDARDVGSTNANPPPPRRPPATRPEPEAAQSPAHRSRDGSVSPSSRKRRRLRRNSDDGDNHIESNSCDVPAQSTPVPNIPASITTTPIRTPIVKPEVNDRLDHNTLPAESGLLKEKIEPAEPLLEPKTEYLEDLNNDDSVEDLTLDDDDEMDMSQMSNLSNMSRPGPSHGADLSNQGFPPWQLGNQSGTDEVFMAAQEAVNAHRDSQENSDERRSRCHICGEEFEWKCDLTRHRLFCRKSLKPIQNSSFSREDSSSPILLADEDQDEEMPSSEDVALPFNEEPSEDNLQSAFEDELACRGNASSRFEDQSSPLNDVPGPFDDEEILPFENPTSFEGEEPSHVGQPHFKDGSSHFKEGPQQFEEGPPEFEDEPPHFEEGPQQFVERPPQFEDEVPTNDEEPTQIENNSSFEDTSHKIRSSCQSEREASPIEEPSQPEPREHSENLSHQFDEEVPTNEDISPPFEDELPPLPILTPINNGMPFFTPVNKDLPILTPMSELAHQMNQRHVDFSDGESEVAANTKLPTLTPMNRNFQILPQANESSQSPKRDLPILTRIPK